MPASTYVKAGYGWKKQLNVRRIICYLPKRRNRMSSSGPLAKKYEDQNYVTIRKYQIESNQELGIDSSF